MGFFGDVLGFLGAAINRHVRKVKGNIRGSLSGKPKPEQPPPHKIGDEPDNIRVNFDIIQNKEQGRSDKS